MDASSAKQVRNDCLEALGLLTRLPVRLSHEPRGAGAAWAYPLVGWLVGAIAGLIAWFALGLGLPIPACAALALLTQVVLTGALHEDGLADWADALGARGGSEARLAVMKDSQTGAFGLIALIFSFGLRAIALTSLLASSSPLALILGLSGGLSRAVMTLPMAALPHARADGLARLTGRPSAKTAVLALLIGALPVLVLTGPGGMLLLFAVLVIGSIPAIWASRKIGGQTGDILGATQQCAEIAALLALSAVLN